MMYTWDSDCRRPIDIGVHGIYVNRLCDLSQTIYIDASGMRTYVTVGIQHVWGPMEGDDVV